MKSSLRRSLDYVFYGGIAQSAVDTFATGSLITAYALLLGANNIAIGILGAVPYIGNLMHILASYILEKGYSVKKLSLITSFLSRPFYLFAALLAFFAGESWTVPALILFLTTVYSIGNIAGGAWRPWMKELVPDSIMGRFFAHRFKYMMIAKVVCFLIAIIIYDDCKSCLLFNCLSYFKSIGCLFARTRNICIFRIINCYFLFKHLRCLYIHPCQRCKTFTTTRQNIYSKNFFLFKKHCICPTYVRTG